MTNKINMAELLADREKGSDKFTFDHDWMRWPTIFDEDGQPVATIEKDGFPGRFGHTERQSANARRLTRTPDLEAAFIEAVEALQRITEVSMRYSKASMIARATLEEICHD